MGALNLITSNDLDLANHREELSAALNSIAGWADSIRELADEIVGGPSARKEVLADAIIMMATILGASADDLNQRILKNMPFRGNADDWIRDVAPYRQTASEG